MTLTREEKRVRIAGALGLKDVQLRLVNEGTGMDAWILSSGVIGNGGFAIPDYFSDLNACHEMEKAISTSEQRADFSRHLIQILNDALRNTPRFIGPSSFDQTHAAAEHRAEAFGLALGLWQPGE